MNDISILNKILASKRLARTKLQFSDDLFNLDVMWCRTAYDCNENWTTKKHCHTFYEMQFPITGVNTIRVNNKKDFTFSSGEFLLIPPKVQHQIVDVSSDFSKFVFGFNISFNENHTDYPYFDTAFKKVSADNIYKSNAKMFDLINSLLIYAFEQKPGFLTSVSKTLELLLVETANAVLPNFSEYSYGKKQFEQDIRIESIYKFIDDNISSQITCEDVAKQIHISTKHLNRISQKETGKTIGELIRDRKITAIKDLLEKTDMSLREIAESLGFSNEFNLIRFFKTAEGLTPGKYRASLKM